MDPRIEPSPRRTAGFSLLELVVVIAVVGILSLGVSLSLSGGRSTGGYPRDATRFENQYSALRDSAIHSRMPVALSLKPAGWQVMRRAGDVWQGEGPRVRWSGSAVFQRDLSAPVSPVPVPEVIFLPDGRSSAFSIRFTDAGQVAQCSSDGWQGLECGL